jgi:2-oxo-4-hydroxy-4-carboxy--5-ureidoimidazoline (OHCU) decarboxylase
MVRKICEQFGMEYTGEAERRMRAFLAANAAYQERFGMPSERI